MPVSGFRDRQTSLVAAAGVFTRNEAKKSSILRCAGKTLEVSRFYDHRKRSDGFNAEEAFQFVNVFLVLFIFRKLFNPLFDPIQLARQVVVGKQIFFQRFPIDAIKL